MIKLIVDNLKNCKERTESIDIAKGKYKLPNSLKEILKQVKNG